MVREIKEFTRRKRYNWAALTSGKLLEATKGQDFHCSAPGFAATLYTYSRRNRIPVEVSIIDDERVEFRFVKGKRK